ncbi:Golgi integral membrane protein 4-like isoform X2 [Rhineura floridana]|uniref:Golgi integral membrane protein 4-like isoform X2 n=1 Tax=Rhineura floridana TaxID=261503 RepID=UPI002AC87F20|nr:Golgi integral membrane protein 4-like isoform X2 [Rhineura floridana]
MGTGMCTRRQKGLLQMGFCLVAMACLASGGYLYNHLQQKVKSAEALALKYKQQQEVLSAQLQVVYEHRSRLERSLQKERGEHKKTKEDFLVYKLEAQEALNKEKQDSMNRYGALSSQHKILKNQHEDVKKELLDLQLQHNGLKLEHRKTVETHNQKYSQLQKEKESTVGDLQDTVYKLREENKLLRKAHQDIHTQLLSAQVQMEEFRQLKETLQKMPSFKGVGAAKGQPKLQASLDNEAKPPLSPLGQAAAPAQSSLVAQASGIKHQGEETVHEGPVMHGDDRPQGNMPFGQLAPPQEAHVSPPVWPRAGQRDTPIVRFTRMVNSLQNGNQDQKAVQSMPGVSEENVLTEAIASRFRLPPASEQAQPSDQQLSVGSKRDPAVQSWQEIVNKVSARMDEEPALHYPQGLIVGTRAHQGMANGQPVLANQQRRAEPQRANWEAGKGGMDAGMIEKEDNSLPQKDTVIQEPMVPDDAADPAEDPNNQGEDEFEEAELERPDFEENLGQAGQLGHTSEPPNDASKEKIQKDAGGPKKMGDNLMDDYQEDQEQDLEDHGGEVDDRDDLPREARGHAGGDEGRNSKAITVACFLILLWEV